MTSRGGIAESSLVPHRLEVAGGAYRRGGSFGEACVGDPPPPGNSGVCRLGSATLSGACRSSPTVHPIDDKSTTTSTKAVINRTQCSEYRARQSKMAGYYLALSSSKKLLTEPSALWNQSSQLIRSSSRACRNLATGAQHPPSDAACRTCQPTCFGSYRQSLQRRLEAWRWIE
jgi:hypothetical protein